MPGRPPGVPRGAMAAGFGRGFLRFSTGVGRTLRPAVWPLAFGAAGSSLLKVAGATADDIGRAVNPPLESTPIDLNGDGVPETVYIFDRKTGLLNAHGQPPAATQENDRQELEKLTVVAVVAGAVLVVGLMTFGGRK